jgi:hypothetical protein
MRDDRFVGAWDLIDARSVSRTGERTPDPLAQQRGQITYTPEGRVSVCITNVDGTSGGYWGRWVVQPAGSRVEHHLLGASELRLLGTVQLRGFAFEGDMLILSTPAEPNGSHREIVWRRATLESCIPSPLAPPAENGPGVGA